MAKNLAVFDFDHTVVEDNSDTAVIGLLDKGKIPKKLKMLHRSDGWTAFMQGIFKLLHENNKTEHDIRKVIKNLEPVDGMCELIKTLNKNNNYDVIIISDSNSYFINLWLTERNLDSYVMKVFTNPAYFDENGLLIIEMYHLQEHCTLSTKNLCKGQVLEEFLEEQAKKNVNYDKIIYCGDGSNDFCPLLHLRVKDVACVRDKYKCLELVQKAQRGEHYDEFRVPIAFKPDVCIWNNAYDIMKYLDCGQ